MTELDPTTERMATEALALTRRNGGGTFEAKTMLPFTPKDGFAVGVGGVTFSLNVLPPSLFAMFADVVPGEYITPYFGTWVTANVVHIDAVEYFSADRKADACLRAMECGQEAIYDFGAAESIFLGEVPA